MKHFKIPSKSFFLKWLAMLNIRDNVESIRRDLERLSGVFTYFPTSRLTCLLFYDGPRLMGYADMTIGTNLVSTQLITFPLHIVRKLAKINFKTKILLF